MAHHYAGHPTKPHGKAVSTSETKAAVHERGTITTGRTPPAQFQVWVASAGVTPCWIRTLKRCAISGSRWDARTAREINRWM